MSIYEDYLGWIVGFFILLTLCILAMLMRNRAAKTDSVGRTEIDTVRNSVSLDPKKNTTKLD